MAYASAGAWGFEPGDSEVLGRQGFERRDVVVRGVVQIGKGAPVLDEVADDLVNVAAGLEAQLHPRSIDGDLVVAHVGLLKDFELRLQVEVPLDRCGDLVCEGTQRRVLRRDVECPAHEGAASTARTYAAAAS